ncbi:hypothetical protein DC498_15315 [Terrimonas sp.]|uniref:hypothetical protein n=1 Tax=Terrimonas sp. TaxID=1914338 RepID=UPI000D5101E9|nr:hypothetical protein [Terrimonas sp.]PVD51251.1 hypothetical protein DC498_15315 [Terrimonas sp.]
MNETGVKEMLYKDCFFSTMPVNVLVEGVRNITVPAYIIYTARSPEYRDILIAGILSSKLDITKKQEIFIHN